MKLSYSWEVKYHNKTDKPEPYFSTHLKTIRGSDIEIAKDKLDRFLLNNKLVITKQITFGITGETKLFYVTDES